MRRARALLALFGLVTALVPACNGGFPSIGQGRTISITILKGDVGSKNSPLPIATDIANPATFTVRLEALKPDGTVDTSFNGHVNLTAEPGTVVDLTVRNVQLHAGVLDNVVVPITGAFGDAHLQATDLGYEPAAPDRKPPPECSDGIDNNGNGLIDYPADPGCYAPVDDTEALGTYAEGVSQPLHFALPRIPLVRGYDPGNNGNGNATAFPHQQIAIDTGWRGSLSYDFSTVVIGLTAAGFYVQDLQNASTDQPTGYTGLYAYNFSTPTNMDVCDRVQLLSGTASDFYGFTELNYPTWQIEFWNPAVRPCMVPEPTVLGPPDLANNNRLWQEEATLVRVQTSGTISAHVAQHFGPGMIPKVNGTYTPDNTHSSCDFNRNGKVDFTDAAENDCSKVCVGTCANAPTDFECSEWSQFQSQNNFDLVVVDSSTGAKARVQANAAAAASFNPVEQRDATGNPLPVRSFTGLLAYFSGGCQFTMNARCDDDVIADPHGTPLPSNVACVHPRTLSQINANTH